jgi:hypothetical protein
MPIITEIAAFVPINLENYWLLWVGSVAFVSAFVVIRWKAPAIILEYPNYKEFEERSHAHRWIVWELYWFLPSLPADAREKTIRETKFKKITSTPPEPPLADFPELDGDGPVEFATPIQVDRDIYLPVRMDRDICVIAMKEDDTDLAAKTKELFWIMFSAAAKARPKARDFVWHLYTLAVLCLGISVINNILKAILPSPPIEYLCAIVRWAGVL